jgi:hypothetical protein
MGMNLLYCDSNGVVVGIHDDTLVPVPSSAYPTAVRVIPYDQSLSTLARIGPAPPDYSSNPPADTGSPPSVYVKPDSRPYQQPTETPHILTMYAAQVRFETVSGGFNFAAASGTVPVKTDRESWLLIGNLAQHAATLVGTAAVDFTQDNIHYPLTATECGTMFTQFANLQQQCRTIEANVIADQNLTTPTLLTYADVDSQFSGVRANTLRFGKK